MASKLKKILGFFKRKPKFHNTKIYSPELAQFYIDSDRISVSGLSSGGFVAHLLHINYPEIVKGVGIFAGGPFGLAELSNILFIRKTLTSKKIDAYDIIAKFHHAQSCNKLGDLELMKKAPVYIYYSKADPTVSASVSQALIKLYEAIGVENLKVRALEDAGHGLPVISGGLDRKYSLTPFLINCDFEASHEALEHIYGHNSLFGFKESTTPAGRLIDFSQKPFKTAFGKLDYLANQGFAYIPPAALHGEKCGVHLALHGCMQSVEFVGKTFINYSAYMDWADKNKLIILFPQTQKTIKNPLACWDWFGISDKNYANRQSKLLQTLIAMIFALEKPESQEK